MVCEKARGSSQIKSSQFCVAQSSGSKSSRSGVEAIGRRVWECVTRWRSRLILRAISKGTDGKVMSSNAERCTKAEPAEESARRMVHDVRVNP